MKTLFYNYMLLSIKKIKKIFYTTWYSNIVSGVSSYLHFQDFLREYSHLMRLDTSLILEVDNVRM